jgi:glycosyltransferase involved in cell wall biosynthesis
MKLLIGGNGEIEHLKDKIKKHKLEELVEFLGWITNTRKIDVLNSCDVFILPSYNEGLPVSVLESMSYGKTIISTNVGGIPEIVRHGENGLLINPGNLEELKNAIDYVFLHPEKLPEYGKASEQIVRKHLPGEVIKELRAIYESVLM